MKACNKHNAGMTPEEESSTASSEGDKHLRKRRSRSQKCSGMREAKQGVPMGQTQLLGPGDRILIAATRVQSAH